MAGLSAPSLIAIALATCAIALTIDELLQPRLPYLTFPENGWAGGLVLFALLGAVTWVLRDVRHNHAAASWAKAALTIAAVLPMVWIFRAEEIIRELSQLGDTDLPDGWSERMVGDVFQTQLVALVLSASVVVCIVATCIRRP